MNNRIALLDHSQEYARYLRNLGDHLDFYNKPEEPERNKYVKDRLLLKLFRQPITIGTPVSETTNLVVIYHSDSLHKCINNCRTDKIHSSFFEVS